MADSQIQQHVLGIAPMDVQQGGDRSCAAADHIQGLWNRLAPGQILQDAKRPGIVVGVVEGLTEIKKRIGDAGQPRIETDLHRRRDVIQA